MIHKSTNDVEKIIDAITEIINKSINEKSKKEVSKND